MNDKQVKEEFLNHFKLGNELYTMVESNIIPAFIADKIKEKIKDAHVELSKKQLYELVDIIKKEIQTKKYSYNNNYPSSKNDEDTPKDYISESEDEELENIFNSINNLGGRIEKIEDTQLKDYNDSVKGIVKTEDIHIPEKIYGSKYEIKNHTLQEIPSDPERVVVLMKWLQFLVDNVGKNNLSNVFDYYVDIGWISDKVVPNLIEYSEGVTQEKNYIESTEKRELQANDHIQSLLFILRLKGEQPDKYFLHRIERNINKMTKNLI
jgi:flagellar protein FlaD